MKAIRDDTIAHRHWSERDRLALERCTFLEASTPFRELKADYLRAHGRHQRWPDVDSWTPNHRALELESPNLCQSLQERIGRLAEYFSLAPWIVEWLIAIPREEALYGHWFPLSRDVKRSIVFTRGGVQSPFWRKGPSYQNAGFRVMVDQGRPAPTEPSAAIEFDLGWPANAAAAEAANLQTRFNDVLASLGHHADTNRSTKPAIVIESHRDDLADKFRRICWELGLSFRLVEWRPAVAEPTSVPPSQWSTIRAVLLLPAGGTRTAASRTAREALRALREVLRQAGFDPPGRLRASPATRDSAILHLEQRELRHRQLFEFVTEDTLDGDVEDDERRVRLLKSRRYHVRARMKRLGLDGLE